MGGEWERSSRGLILTLGASYELGWIIAIVVLSSSHPPPHPFGKPGTTNRVGLQEGLFENTRWETTLPFNRSNLNIPGGVMIKVRSLIFSFSHPRSPGPDAQPRIPVIRVDYDYRETREEWRKDGQRSTRFNSVFQLEEMGDGC